MHRRNWSRLVMVGTGTLLSLVLSTACVQYEAEPFTGYTLPRVTGYTTGITNDWLYFNLHTGEVYNLDAPNQDIREGEQYERTDWDLAFCGYRLRTNSGTSGVGQGGAADLGYEGYNRWERVSQLPDTLTWAVDDSTVTVTMSRSDWNKYLIANSLDFDANPWFDPNNGPARTVTSANPILARSMTFTGPPPVYTPSFHTYVVRAADGVRYYKLQIISWYKADHELGDSGGEISYYVSPLEK